MRAGFPAGAILAAAVATGAGGCADSRKLDEAVVVERPELTLKVVHLRERLPLHYDGHRYRVYCRSPATEAVYARAAAEPGWRPIGDLLHDNQGRSAEAFVAAVRDGYPIHAPGLMTWSAIALSATWDGCGRIAQWDPAQLPGLFIDPVPKPDHCRPRGGADCRYYDFQNARRPVYQLAAVTPGGRLEFSVHTPALRHRLRVATANAGRVWHVVPEQQDPAAVAALQQIDAGALDTGVDQVPLRRWLDENLPAAARAMVVWSAGPVACEQTAAVAECVELFVTTRWGDEARLLLRQGPPGRIWQSAGLTSAGGSVALARLRDLPAALSRR